MYKIRPTPNSDSIKLCLRYTARDPRLRSKKFASFRLINRSSGEVTGGLTASNTVAIRRVLAESQVSLYNQHNSNWLS